MSNLARSIHPEAVRLLGAAAIAQPRAKPLSLSVGDTDLGQLLPHGGLPRGAVVELSAPRAMGHATSFALAACAAAQAEAREHSGDRDTAAAWCAFVDPWSTLHGPSLHRARVDSARLLVVRPPLEKLARVSLRIAESRVFGLIVIDTAGVPGVELSPPESTTSVPLDRWAGTVRRLAHAIQRSGTSIVLITDAAAPRRMPLPVAMRLDLQDRPTQRLLRRVP